MKSITIAAFSASLVAILTTSAHAGTYGNRVSYGGSLIRASWYSSGYRTASGEHFNPNGFTAAHRTFPFGTRLAVTNPTNGRTVIVRINDRGPFVRGISLDLARGAAFALGMRGTGVVRIAQVGRTTYSGWESDHAPDGSTWQEAQNEAGWPRKGDEGTSNEAERFWGSPLEHVLN